MERAPDTELSALLNATPQAPRPGDAAEPDGAHARAPAGAAPAVAAAEGRCEAAFARARDPGPATPATAAAVAGHSETLQVGLGLGNKDHCTQHVRQHQCGLAMFDQSPSQSILSRWLVIRILRRACRTAQAALERTLRSMCYTTVALQ